MCYIKIYAFYFFCIQKKNRDEINLVLKCKLLKFMLVKNSAQFKIISGKTF